VRGSPDNNDLVPLHEPFETALRGFNRRQVLEHLESLDGRIAVVAADRDAALTQVAELSKVMNHLRLQSDLLEYLRREAHEASARVDRVLATPMAEASARIHRILRLAEEEAAELKATAQAQIVAGRAHADHELAELRARADEQIASLRAHASREAKSLLEHARRQCDQLEADSAARREAAEQDAAQAIAQREAAASAGIRDSELRSIARFHLMHQIVGEQLATRMCAVERDESALRELRVQVAEDVTALETLRTEVTAALAATYQVLTEALGQIGRTAIARLPADSSPAERAEVPASPVPTQRSAGGGTVYLLNAGAEDRRSPRAPS
jgi:cell division septum initiation protein DivIVA